jgi:serine protease AprX
VTIWRKLTAGALTGAICLFGLTATADAAASTTTKKKVVVKAPHAPKQPKAWGAKPTDHPKLDRKLNDRADFGGSGNSSVIVEYKPGTDLGQDYAKVAAKRGRKLDIIGAEVVDVPNSQLRRLADNKNVLAIHHNRKTGGEMNRVSVVEGARAVQAQYGLDGAGIGVAVIDSGITSWHDDLTYNGANPLVKVVNGQRVRKFVDFVNGLVTPYDDNGHGTHVAGIIAGNGGDTGGARGGIAPAANLVSLKVLDDHGGGYISNVIAALDWVVANRAAYNIRVVNVSVGAAVTESYTTDPLTLAAKRVVDAGVVVVTAAGNLGTNPVTGKVQYGGITAPGNAPWVLTVGAYSHEGTLNRKDDKMGLYSSRGPTARDFIAKPDVVATGTGIVSLSVDKSTLYKSKAAFLLAGTVRTGRFKPYLSLTGTSMAAPVVTGAVALMLQANPNLTPNLVKALIQYTAQDYHYDPMTQGAGFLNIKGAVDLARFLKNPKAGQQYPKGAGQQWSKTILWGNHKLTNGVIKPSGSAWKLGTVWGAFEDGEGDNIVWGTQCPADDAECDNIVWGTSVLDTNTVWGSADCNPESECDNIVWGTSDCAPEDECDNIVWGTACGDEECDNIVWGTECGEADCDNIVWGTQCADGECDNIVWGTQCDSAEEECDNIVWGTADNCAPDQECDNIVWGTTAEVPGSVWGASSESDNLTWGCSAGETPVFDDPDDPSVFDNVVFDDLFGTPAAPVPTRALLAAPPPANLPPAGSTGLAGGF